MKPISQMTEEERLQEISELLATAALRYLRKQGPKPPYEEGQSPAQSEVWDLVDDELERQILRFLKQHVSADPTQIRSALGVSEMTLVRRLARLRGVGLIQVSGKTRNARYELAPEAGRN